MPAYYADMPDAMLVVAAILGDRAAFDALALRYRRAVVRAAEAMRETITTNRPIPRS